MLGRELDAEAACYQFGVGLRSKDEQKDLYDRWHHIADKRAHDKRDLQDICQDLKAADFAQLPSGVTWVDPKTRSRCKGEIKYQEDGRTANGGPAVPGTSRHESGMAADIKVTFPPGDAPDIGKYQQAAESAGLCGPPKGDSVHVELPYTRADDAHKTPTFACHFPEGPAPAAAPPAP
jgi:hypothetical protein